MPQDSLENIDILIRSLKNRGLFWNCASVLTISSVGLFSKLIVGILNNCHFYNIEQFNRILKDRGGAPLITVSNHVSCFDDPGLWGTLKVSQLFKADQMRWSLAAHDVCFTNKLHSYFFLLGKCLPTIRGCGVYQSSVDLCIEQLKKGQWVHVFPEGKINVTKDFIRLKWGVGRLIYEPPVTPIVVPIWHIGMDDVLPNRTPYRFQYGQNLTFNFGEPINFNDLIKSLKSKTNVTPEEAKKIVCDKIQIELLKLKTQTVLLHKKYYGTS